MHLSPLAHGKGWWRDLRSGSNVIYPRVLHARRPGPALRPWRSSGSARSSLPTGWHRDSSVLSGLCVRASVLGKRSVAPPLSGDSAEHGCSGGAGGVVRLSIAPTFAGGSTSQRLSRILLLVHLLPLTLMQVRVVEPNDCLLPSSDVHREAPRVGRRCETAIQAR